MNRMQNPDPTYSNHKQMFHRKEYGVEKGQNVKGKKEQNVKIPLSLLLRTIHLMEHLEVFGYDLAIQHDYHDVYAAFLKKRQDLELRKSYAKIIFAEDEDARFNARVCGQTSQNMIQ